MAEGDPQKHSPFPDAETDPREAEQTAMALSTVAAEEHAHQLLPRSAPRRRLSVQERAGPPKTRLAGRAAETRAGGRGGHIHCLFSAFCILSFSFSCGVSLGWGRGRRGGRGGGCPELPPPTSSKSLGLAGGTWGGRTGCQGPPQGSGRPGDSWSPGGQCGGDGDTDLTGQSIPSPLQPQGWLSQPPRVPPAGPPGPALGHCCWRELDGRVPNSY